MARMYIIRRFPSRLTTNSSIMVLYRLSTTGGTVLLETVQLHVEIVNLCIEIIEEEREPELYCAAQFVHCIMQSVYREVCKIVNQSRDTDTGMPIRPY
jgi:hypothetical protein